MARWPSASTASVSEGASATTRAAGPFCLGPKVKGAWGAAGAARTACAASKNPSRAREGNGRGGRLTRRKGLAGNRVHVDG